jgi:hypothetical protein
VGEEIPPPLRKEYKMQISVFPGSLRITSKKSALEFYKCVKHCMVIPYTDEYVLRIEPDNCFTVISKYSIQKGEAWMIPSFKDQDGKLAYNYRKYINAWLTR